MSAPRFALLVVVVLLAGVVPEAGAAARIVRPADAARLSERQLGAELYAANCARCHGSLGAGITANDPEGAGPPLLGAGALAPDFYLRTGYMPLGEADVQPQRSRPSFDEREIRALVGYVDALAAGGPPIPAPQPERGSVSEGMREFTSHCAGCHQVVAEGGVVTGARVPALDEATPVQIAQAVRIGPYVMPTFSPSQISDAELDSIIAYVQYAKAPDDAGGWGIGHLGPFPEGMVTWLLAAVALVVLCVLVAGRSRAS